MSRFVSAGGADEPSGRDEAWLEAERKIEATRTQKKPDVGQQDDGKSLYETLQANKAAKQDAFEEATRLRNQFRSLDEDEVEFLDSVLESTRSKEAEVKKETKEQLEAFRKQREEAEKVAKQEEMPEAVPTAETWAVGPRKRKKGKENQTIGGVKLRRTSTADAKDQGALHEPKTAQDTASQTAKRAAAPKKDDASQGTDVASKKEAPPTAVVKPTAVPVAGLGLAAYSSDEDE